LKVRGDKTKFATANITAFAGHQKNVDSQHSRAVSFDRKFSAVACSTNTPTV